MQIESVGRKSRDKDRASFRVLSFRNLCRFRARCLLNPLRCLTFLRSNCSTFRIDSVVRGEFLLENSPPDKFRGRFSNDVHRGETLFDFGA